MKEKNKKKRNLRSKIFLLCFVLVIITALGGAVMIFQYVYELMRVASDTDDRQLELVDEKATKSLNVTMRTLFLCTTDILAANLEGELWTAKHDMDTLAQQVQDVFEHPENYAEKDIELPKRENGGKFALQLMMPEGTDPEEAMKDPMARKLANLEPLMNRVVSGNNEYVMDCFIEMPNGLSVAMDSRSDQKILPDGSVTPYDPREEQWYLDTLSSDGFYLSPMMHSHFYDVDEIVLGVPVVVDGRTVAVIQTSMITEKLEEIIARTGNNVNTIALLVDRDGRIIYSPMTEGELAMDGPNAADMRKSDNQGLVDLFAAADYAKDLTTSGYQEVEVDGVVYGVGFNTMETSRWTLMLFKDAEEFDRFGNLVVGEMQGIMEEADSVYSRMFMKHLFIVLAAMVIMVVIAYFASRHYSHSIVTPINTMTEQVGGIVDRDFDFEMKEVYRTGDEVEVLADAFHDLSEKTKGYIRDLVDVTSAKERLDTELDVATRIQAGMMPDDFDAVTAGKPVELYATMEPAKEVGGDFYDFFLIDDDHLCLVMADVSDKGVPAALFAVRAKTLLKIRAQMGGTPAEILHDVNNRLCENNAEFLFVTVWLAILTISTGEIVDANGGHEYPAIRRGDGPYELYLTRHSLVLGSMEDTEYDDSAYRLEKGDCLFIYTDGLPEAYNEEEKRLGNERMLEILNRHREDMPEAFLKHIREDLKEYTGDRPQSDDVTMLAVVRT